jgi:hypothetical protein
MEAVPVVVPVKANTHNASFMQYLFRIFEITEGISKNSYIHHYDLVNQAKQICANVDDIGRFLVGPGLSVMYKFQLEKFVRYESMMRMRKTDFSATKVGWLMRIASDIYMYNIFTHIDFANSIDCEFDRMMQIFVVNHANWYATSLRVSRGKSSPLLHVGRKSETVSLPVPSGEEIEAMLKDALNTVKIEKDEKKKRAARAIRFRTSSSLDTEFSVKDAPEKKVQAVPLAKSAAASPHHSRSRSRSPVRRRSRSRSRSPRHRRHRHASSSPKPKAKVVPDPKAVDKVRMEIEKGVFVSVSRKRAIELIQSGISFS